MAFDFLGTCTKQDVAALKTFLQSQLDNSNAQINNMILETNKLGKTLTLLETRPSKINVKSKWFATSFDRRERPQVDDSDSAEVIQLIKEPYYENIKEKEYLECKIRKVKDVIEQIQERVHLLRISRNEFEVRFEEINSMFTTPRDQYLQVEETL